MGRFSPTQKIGVIEAERIFTSEFEWVTRRILESDFGVDMEIEITEEGNPLGQLIGAQIKTGKSYFKTDRAGNIVYHGTKTHLDYWLNHSLPIIIVLHNPDTNQTVWQKISIETVSVTKKGFKVEIPPFNNLNKEAIEKIKILNKYPLYFQRLQRLGIHRELIQEVFDGNKIVLELDEWANKTIGRVGTKIKRVSEEDGEERLLSEGSYIHFSVDEDIFTLYPWADFVVDEDYYEFEDESDFYTNHGIWDSEEKQYIGATIEYSEYKLDLPKIRHIEKGGGEIYHYRLVFSVNDLGKSFLKLHDYLEKGSQLKLNL